ncbi:MAG: ABC transporter substrate-binding protein [Pseudomonadota bacterium]
MVHLAFKIVATCLFVFSLALETPRAHAEERTVVWARSGDALTLDPHAMNEGPTLTLLRQIYEPLVALDHNGRLEPAIAKSWSLTRDPKVWRFELFDDVAFHDGSRLTVNDVVFSLRRAMAPSSDMRSLISNIVRIEPTDGTALLIETKAPDRLLPTRLSHIFILSQRWATQNGLETPRRRTADQADRDVRIANGTGPFRLVRRAPGRLTELAAASDWRGWRGRTPAISRLVYRPIPNANDRIAALTAGDVDFVQDVPANALPTLALSTDIRLNVGPDNRAIFIGLNVDPKRKSIQSVLAANPLSDIRVRRALNLAIDREAIQRTVMNGQSLPSGVVAPPQINGYPRQLDRVQKPNVDQARKLLTEAGVADGFKLTLNCPNDRYLNDAEICAAVSRQLAEIGVMATVVAQSKTAHFPLIRSGGADMYLLGWGVPTFDSAYVFEHLFHSRGQTAGSWNGTSYSDPIVDRAIAALDSEINQAKRALIVANLWERLHEEMIYLPLHIQTLSYAMSKDLDIQVDVTNKPRLAFARVLTSGATSRETKAGETPSVR